MNYKVIPLNPELEQAEFDSYKWKEAGAPVNLTLYVALWNKSEESAGVKLYRILRENEVVDTRGKTPVEIETDAGKKTAFYISTFSGMDRIDLFMQRIHYALLSAMQAAPQVG